MRRPHDFSATIPLVLSEDRTCISYVGNNPANYTDPLGLQRGEPGAAAAAAGQLIADGLLALESCAEKERLKYNSFSLAGKPRYAHCIASCYIMRNCGGPFGSGIAGVGKELRDLGMWLKTGDAAARRSALQPSDFKDDWLGLSCPANKSCEQRCEPLNFVGDGKPGPFDRWPFTLWR